MKTLTLAALAVFTGLFSSAAFSKPGEYWEVTSRIDMPGMPAGMSSTKTKVCIAKGSEKDPGQLMRSRNSSDCQLTDVKTSGNKTTWKVKCNSDEMTGSGEMTHSANSYDGVMHLSGKDGKMTQTYHGKRTRESCDTDNADVGGYAQANAAYMQSAANMQNMAMQEMQCNTDGYTASKWIDNSDRFLKGNTCSGNKKVQLCLSMRNEVPHDADAYPLLVETEKTNGKLITKSCKLNMASITKTICGDISDGKFSDKDVDKLAAYCPSEAKKYSEANRSGRSYTSDSHSGSSAAENAIESAKKLKGLFGF
jgi:hypothetical protein